VKKRVTRRRKTATLDLGIAGWRVPIHSHIACLWRTKRDFSEAVGFVEAGLRGRDHCVVVGEEEETAPILAILKSRGIDLEGAQASKRLILLRPDPSAKEMLGRITAAFKAAVTAGASVVRLFGNVGWDRKSWPTDAELVAFEARLTELAERFPCVLLCLHELPSLTGLMLRYGVVGTHAQMLEGGSVSSNPRFLSLEKSPRRLAQVAAQLSKQQKARETLRRENEILQAIFDNIPVMISFSDPSGRLLLVNREWERVLGWSLEEAQRLEFLAEPYPDPERRREVLEFMRKAEQRWQDFRTRTKDGRVIDTSWLRVGLSNGTRIGFGLDLTERKRLEKGIKTTEALLSEGEKLSQTGSWVLNLGSGKLFWSVETFRIFGMEPGQEAPSHPIFHELLRPADYSVAENTVPPEDRSALQKTVARAIAERSGFEADHRVIRPDGSVRDIHAVGHPVFGESGELLEFVGVLTDMTEERLAQESLRRSHDELRSLSQNLRTVREEERTRISREIHDEIGQALTALQMDVAWLEKRLSSAGPSNEILVGKLQSMAGMIDKTMEAVQKIATELRPGVLDELGLGDAVDWFVREFEKRTGISCRIQSNLNGTSIAPDLATAAFRILQEALTNVARHAGATQVQVDLSADDRRLTLEIKDNGRGIAEDRATDSRSLGLLGMRERARALGGDVRIRGVPGHGTSVILSLPR
jgi:PAS domain S-box-containing protein